MRTGERELFLFQYFFSFFFFPAFLLIKNENKGVVPPQLWLCVCVQPVFGSSLSLCEARGWRRQCGYDKKVRAFPLLSTHTYTHTHSKDTLLFLWTGVTVSSVGSALPTPIYYRSDPVSHVTQIWPVHGSTVYQPFSIRVRLHPGGRREVWIQSGC